MRCLGGSGSPYRVTGFSLGGGGRGGGRLLCCVVLELVPQSLRHGVALQTPAAGGHAARRRQLAKWVLQHQTGQSHLMSTVALPAYAVTRSCPFRCQRHEARANPVPTAWRFNSANYSSYQISTFHAAGTYLSCRVTVTRRRLTIGRIRYVTCTAAVNVTIYATNWNANELIHTLQKIITLR